MCQLELLQNKSVVWVNWLRVKVLKHGKLLSIWGRRYRISSFITHTAWKKSDSQKIWVWATGKWNCHLLLRGRLWQLDRGKADNQDLKLESGDWEILLDVTARVAHQQETGTTWELDKQHVCWPLSFGSLENPLHPSEPISTPMWCVQLISRFWRLYFPATQKAKNIFLPSDGWRFLLEGEQRNIPFTDLSIRLICGEGRVYQGCNSCPLGLKETQLLYSKIY